MMKKWITVLIVSAMLSTLLIPQGIVNAADYNYGEALQKAVMFYEFQRSGKLPSDKRDNWRGDSGMNDGKDVGVDLTGGWYDAGDHVKFNLPMAYTVAMLSWSAYENKNAYVKSGQLKYIMDDIKWGSDYLIKCHPAPNVYYYQVGDPGPDHAWWGPAEVMQMKRPSYKVDSASPGSTVVAESAAALAITSVVFKDTNPDYAANCLKHAKEMLEFADSTRSDAGYSAASGYYSSWSGFWDELSWASIWIYLATNDSTYLTRAESYVAKWPTEPQTTIIANKWAHCWDDVHYGSQLLLARLTDKQVYKDLTENSLDFWTTGADGKQIKYSPKGLAYLDQWGSLRYATTMAFLADIYASWSGCTPSKVDTYKKFAKSQIDYALGSTGRSFVVGFGENPPKRPHHRTAHSSWFDSQTVPNYHRHTLYGALVGGPDATDKYTDDISNYTTNEVACDYNAGFVGLLARMYDVYGGNPIPDFKAIEDKTNDELFVESSINSIGSNYIEIKALLNNRTGWPARVTDKLSFKYFVDVSELVKAGLSPENVGVNGASKLMPWDTANNIYYVNVDLTGTAIYPGGQSIYRKEVHFRITAPGNANVWDNTNDFSFKGVAADTGKEAINKYIPVYDNGIRVFGEEPPIDGVIATPTVIPTITPTVTPTIVPSVTPTPNVVPSTSPTDVMEGYEFKVNTSFEPAKLVANQMMTAKVVATNISTVPYTGKKDVLLIVALYDMNNTMVNVSYISKGIPYQGSETLSAGFKLPRDVNGYCVRAFMWDGTDMSNTNMIPISNETHIP